MGKVVNASLQAPNSKLPLTSPCYRLFHRISIGSGRISQAAQIITDLIRVCGCKCTSASVCRGVHCVQESCHTGSMTSSGYKPAPATELANELSQAAKCRAQKANAKKPDNFSLSLRY